MFTGPRATPGQARRTILCIDDYETGLTVRKAFLEAKGYRVLAASSGRQGLELLASNPVDGVVVDYKMPEMDGEAVSAEIRRIKPGVPILLFSGYAAEIPARLLQRVDGYFPKGESLPEFLVELERVLDGRWGKKLPARATLADRLNKSRKMVQRSKDLLEDAARRVSRRRVRRPI